MPRRRFTEEVIRPLTIAIVAIMAVAVLALRFVAFSSGENFFSTQTEPLPSLDELLEEAVPTDEEIERMFMPSLGFEELRGEESGLIARDGEAIRVRISKPEGGGPFPAVVLVHDSPASGRATDTIHDVLADRLMQQLNAFVVTVDWRESDYGEGDLTDVISTVDEIRRLAQVQDEPVYLVGFGHGAYLSLLATRDVDVDGVVSAYGYIDPLQQYLYLVQTNEASASAFLQETGCISALEQESCLQGLIITGNIPEPLPVLILHGTDDSLVPISQSERLNDLLSENDATFELITEEGTEHNFMVNVASPGFAPGYNLIAGWLESQLRGSSAGAGADEPQLPEIEQNGAEPEVVAEAEGAGEAEASAEGGDAESGGESGGAAEEDGSEDAAATREEDEPEEPAGEELEGASEDASAGEPVEEEPSGPVRIIR